jgi:chemotaxis protein MotB
MLTFSDCMTLLLTFFVMLLAFSSFDPEPLAFISGAINEPTRPSVNRAIRLPNTSPLEPQEQIVDRTAEGAEKPDFDRLDPILQPRRPLDALSRDAYRDRRVLAIPSDLLFWGLGSQLKPEAAELLLPVAEYLGLVSSQVVVAETSAAGAGPTAEAAEHRAMARAWVLVDHLTRAAGLEPGRFSVSTSLSAPGPDAPQGPAVLIAILNPRVYP